MTRIKLCGLTRLCDIEAANRLRVEYVGFVFVPASRRYVSGREAAALKAALDPSIRAVGSLWTKTRTGWPNCSAPA